MKLFESEQTAKSASGSSTTSRRADTRPERGEPKADEPANEAPCRLLMVRGHTDRAVMSMREFFECLQTS